MKLTLVIEYDTEDCGLDCDDSTLLEYLESEFNNAGIRARMREYDNLNIFVEELV